MEDKVKRAYRQSRNIYDDVLTQNKWWSKLYIRLFWGIEDVKITRKLFRTLPGDFSGTLLDVPCGTINLTAEQYLELEGADITCLDYSEDMLAKAKARMEQYGLSHVSIRQGDVSTLPFADGVFDAVLSMNGFHAFPNKEKAYAETARVLKSGGFFFGCFYVKGECQRSDFAVNTFLSRKGWFTPPFQTKAEVRAILQKYYSSVELHNDRAMVWFNCVK